MKFQKVSFGLDYDLTERDRGGGQINMTSI